MVIRSASVVLNESSRNNSPKLGLMPRSTKQNPRNHSSKKGGRKGFGDPGAPAFSGRWVSVGLVLIFLFGLWLRFPALDEKPLHHDEANQAVKFGDLLETGVYEYDPVDHHGPTLYYLTLPIAWLKGEKSLAEMDAWTIRLLPMVFGVGILALPGLARGALGKVGVLVTSLLLATSPVFVYFSRYYVQEILFVFFSMGALVSLWRYQVSRQLVWAVWFGLFCGLMHTTKETCVLSFAAMIAGTGVLLLGPFLKTKKINFRQLGDPAAAAWALRVWVIVGVVFFSSFFTHWEGVWNALTAYFHTVDRAGGQGHEKPFSWYWSILFNYKQEGYSSTELPLLLAGLIGMVFAFVDKPKNARFKAARFLTVYTLVLWFIYGLIPYKTPWLTMNFLLGFALLGGHGVDRLLKVVRFNDARIAILLLLAMGLFQSHGRALLATRLYAPDMRNPYAYVHTTEDFVTMMNEIRMLADLHERGKGCRVKIFTTSQAEHWPIPWYLRDFEKVTYFVGVPEDSYLESDFLVVHPDLKEELMGKLNKEYYDPYKDYSMREGIILNLIYAQKIWDLFLDSQP
jgi:uncharacterized protein (TIGR03663 family)